MLLGVTGTNGKTTTTWLLEAICAAGGAATGRIGTIDTRFAGRSLEPTHTTPDALALHALFREMVDAGTDTVVMEVCSHALDQDRVHGLTFRAAGFTNLTPRPPRLPQGHGGRTSRPSGSSSARTCRRAAWRW